MTLDTEIQKRREAAAVGRKGGDLNMLHFSIPLDSTVTVPSGDTEMVDATTTAAAPNSIQSQTLGLEPQLISDLFEFEIIVRRAWADLRRPVANSLSGG